MVSQDTEHSYNMGKGVALDVLELLMREVEQKTRSKQKPHLKTAVLAVAVAHMQAYFNGLYKRWPAGEMEIIEAMIIAIESDMAAVVDAVLKKGTMN